MQSSPAAAVVAVGLARPEARSSVLTLAFLPRNLCYFGEASSWKSAVAALVLVLACCLISNLI